MVQSNYNYCHALPCVYTLGCTERAAMMTLCCCVLHIHVQHCHAWPACVVFHAGYSSEVTSHSHACFHQANSFAPLNYVYICAKETLATVNL